MQWCLPLFILVAAIESSVLFCPSKVSVYVYVCVCVYVCVWCMYLCDMYAHLMSCESLSL